MLVVTVELWPGGDITRRRPLRTMTIANVTPGQAQRRDGTALYRVVVDGRPLPGRLVRHRRELGAWALIHRALGRLASSP